MPATDSAYDLEIQKNCTVIEFQPGIGNAAWGDIEQIGSNLLSRIQERPSGAWMIDLSRLEYMGSALVAMLVRIWKAVQAGGGKVVIVCGDGMPQEVLKLAGLDKVWNIARTREAGYRKLGVRETAPVEGDPATAEGASSSGFPILAVLSVVAVAIAAGILAFTLTQSGMERDLALAGIYGGAGVAVALGLAALFKEQSWGRGLGLLAVLGGLATAGAGYLTLPGAERPAAVENADIGAIHRDDF